MKKFIKKLAAAALATALCLSLAACSLKEAVYPVTVDGTEIIVGETKLSALYDAGYKIMSLDIGSLDGPIEIESSYELDANSFYTGLYAEKDGANVVTLAITTELKAVPASDAIIATVSAKAAIKQPMDKITLAGVPVLEMTADKFKEAIAGSKVSEDGTSAYIHGKYYSVAMEYENGTPVSVEMRRKYDVDYNS